MSFLGRRHIPAAAILALTAVVSSAQPISTVTLTFADAVRESLETSPEVKVALSRAQEAGLEEPALLAELDPRFMGSYAISDDRSPRAAPVFQGSYSRTERWETGISQNTLLGTQARLVLRNERLQNPALFRILDPTVDSRLNLELEQPLLRHFWGRPDTARRRRARALEAAARGELRRAKEAAVLRAARAYLELHNAQGQLLLKQNGVADARRLLEKYGEKRRYGLAEESDLLQARASLELQEIELLIAGSQLENARHALQAALPQRRGQVLEVVLPSGLPADAPAQPEDTVIWRRSELESARAQREYQEWNLRVARLDTLPDFSVNASYGAAGLNTNYDAAWRDMSSFDHAVKIAGVSLVVPFSYRRERVTRRQAELRLEAARAEEKRLEIAVRKEVRDARQNLELARRRLTAGRRLAEIERRKYQAEQANARRGRSSTDLLLRFLQDVRRADSDLLRAELEQALARLELARSTGGLLEGLGL